MPHPALLNFTPVIGLALCGSGTLGLIRPVPTAHTFGVINASKQETVFYPGLAGRNLGMGIAVLAFTYWRDERALGTMILCLLCNGFSDTYLLVKHYGQVQNVWIHVMNCGIAATVGSGLLGWW